MVKHTPATAVRTVRERALILCEGSQTEPNYLGSLIRDLGLTSIKVPRDHDTDPLILVRRAIKELKKDGGLARAYVVIDRDTHAHFDAAVSCARQHPFFQNRLYVTASYPCFEYWLLLHFERSRAPMSSEHALSRLRTLCPNYEKANLACMDEIVTRIDIAIDHADLSLADAILTKEMNPSTEVHKLMRYLRSLA